MPWRQPWPGRIKQTLQRGVSLLGAVILLAACASQSPGIASGSQGTPSSQALPEACREFKALALAPGHVTKDGQPLYTIQSLRGIANDPTLSLDVIAGRLRAELGDTQRTLEEGRDFNARWEGLCHG